MKKILFILLFACPLLSFSQWVVSDPVLETYAAAEAAERATQTTNTLNTLTEAYKHTEELTKTAAFLQKQYERLHTVNAYITNLSRLEKLVEKQEDIYSDTKEIISELELSDLYTLDELSDLHGALTDMISTTNDIVDMLDLILQPATSMSDGERMQLLRQMEQDFRERQAILNKTLNEYRRLRNQRLVVKALDDIHDKLSDK